ncbi:MAG: hypothetical protein IKX20_06035 [Paludibacteraceae bacterium]|nr:hypothetical protein [Paludibacteraceae bacterium]
MKKNYFLLLAFLILPSMYAYSLDVILTKSRMQIQCNIVSQDETTVTYQLIDPQDKELYTMDKADIEKIYPHTEDIATLTDTKNETQNTEETSNDIIVLNDGTQLDVNLVEVADKQVKYRKVNNPNGPLFVKETANISSIIYANGEKEDFTHTTVEIIEQSSLKTQTPQQQTFSTINNSLQDVALARVENFSGVYVFTDCYPIAEYEVLGEISSSRNQKGNDSFYMSTGGIGGVTMISGGGGVTPQYTDIRSSLISNAILANRQVEGLIIKLPKTGEGSALMIKFKEGTADKSLARVNSHMGIFVFVDNMPINQYTSVGYIKNAKAGSADYNVIRNKLIKLCLKKFPSTQGVIPHLVSGGHDSGEAIKF